MSGLISANTAVAIAVAYQEIARGEKLLADVEKCIKERQGRTNFGVTAETDLRDVFGRRQNSLQLGVPSGPGSHQICDLSYDLARPIINAHIASQKAALEALCLTARAEMEAAPIATAAE